MIRAVAQVVGAPKNVKVAICAGTVDDFVIDTNHVILTRLEQPLGESEAGMPNAFIATGIRLQDCLASPIFDHSRLSQHAVKRAAVIETQLPNDIIGNRRRDR